MPPPPTPSPHRAQRALSSKILGAEWLAAEELETPTSWRVGRYEVLRPLGRGASSEVLLAEDPLMGRRVAIKVLRSDVNVSAERFQQEIKVLANLEHPSIVRIHDAGVTKDGRPFFAMEFVEEGTLDDATLPLDDAVRTLAAVARTCHWAHERSVVHRDLKPANILLGEVPKVADFGVAKLLLADAPQLSAKGALVGTPSYMAPEQISNEGIGPATDVHALGAMLYEQLAGVTPYRADNAMLQLAMIAKGEPEPPSKLRPDVPARLEELALWALATSPEDRPPSAEAFAEELEDWLANRTGKPAAPASEAAAPRELLIVGGLVGVLAVMFLAALLLMNTNRGSDPGAQTHATSAPRPSAEPTPEPTPSTPSTPEPTSEPTPESTPEPTPEPPAVGKLTAKARQELAAAQRRGQLGPQSVWGLIDSTLEAVRTEPGPASSRVFSEAWRLIAMASTGLNATRRVRTPARVATALRTGTELVAKRARAHPDESETVVASATGRFVRWLRLERKAEDLTGALEALERISAKEAQNAEAHLMLTAVRIASASLGRASREQDLARAREALERARRAGPNHPDLSKLTRRLEQGPR